LKRCGTTIFFLFGISIGTINIGNPRRKATSLEDWRQSALAGMKAKSKIP
jgi:hypothetical protein